MYVYIYIYIYIYIISYRERMKEREQKESTVLIAFLTWKTHQLTNLRVINFREGVFF